MQPKTAQDNYHSNTMSVTQYSAFPKQRNSIQSTSNAARPKIEKHLFSTTPQKPHFHARYHQFAHFTDFSRTQAHVT